MKRMKRMMSRRYVESVGAKRTRAAGGVADATGVSARAHDDGRRTMVWTGLLLVMVGCGGSTVVEPGAGGAGATITTSSDGSGGSTTVTTQPGGCDAHDDCPGGLCVFSTGECTEACDSFCGACDAGSVCDSCATSGCPQCLDCVSACVPIQQDQCDDSDPCPSGQTCLWEQSVCVPLCELNGCADPNLVCQSCVTGSCCGCEDCVAACVPAG